MTLETDLLRNTLCDYGQWILLMYNNIIKINILNINPLPPTTHTFNVLFREVLEEGTHFTSLTKMY